MKKINQIFSNKKINILIILLFSIFISLFVEKIVFPLETFHIKRALIIFIIMFFSLIILNYSNKINWNKIFLKRYLIGLILFIILVIFGINGSSSSLYNSTIQPNLKNSNSIKIFGKERNIRSDEWGVSTPTILSQYYNDFDVESDVLMAQEGRVDLYPKIATKSIGIITIPNQIGFLFLPKNQAYSFCWFFGYFLLFFATLELLMIITKKNKLYSTLGAIIITLSPVVQWWESWNIIAYGELAIVFFNLLLNEKKVNKKILLSILIGITGSCYIMCMYPAWQVPYGYVFLVLAIWIILKNKEQIKIKELLLELALIIIIIAVIVIPIILNSRDILNIIMNTVYPGSRKSLGGGYYQKLFDYLISPYNSIVENSNASESAQFISLYPIPLILAIITIVKNKKKDFLLYAFTFLSIFLTLWNFIKIPEFISKITLLSMSTEVRTTNVASYLFILLMIYILSNYEKKKIEFNKKDIIIVLISIVSTVGGLIIVKSLYTSYVSTKKIILDCIIYIPIMYLILKNTKNTNKICLLLLSGISLVSGLLVHPINIGIPGIYDKPVSKKILKIEKKEKDAKWISVDTNFTISNYLVANGANTINSTQYYTNFDLWKKLELKNEDNIYNRFAHLNIILTENKNELKLIQDDNILLNLNIKYLCKLDVDYIYSSNNELEKYSEEKLKIKKIYGKDNSYIYNVSCSKS